MNNRFISLDYIRGICAILIMLYHYTYFILNIKYESDSFIMRMGFYAVSMFYILSGTTLFLVYHKTDFSKKNNIFSFFQKRILRIFPLFIIANILAFFLSKNSLKTLLLNITGLFSIFDRGNYLVTGAWSIANELIFYLFFPLLIFLCNRYIKIFWIISILSLFIMYYFNCYILDEKSPLADNWYYYIHPFNQIYLFIIGIIIGYYYTTIKRLKYSILFPIIGILIFIFYPIEGNIVKLITDSNRIIFSLASTLIVMGAFANYTYIRTYMRTYIYEYMHYILKIIGEISYGIYMLHIILYNIISKLSLLSTKYNLILATLFTLFFSYISYQYFEKYFIKLGKKSS